MERTGQRYMPLAEAQRLVDELNSSEDACGWTYTVLAFEDTGRACIEILDEDGV